MDGPGWSHVYGGRLTIGKQTCVVVVKLYQECMFRDPSPLNFYGLEGIFDGDWPSGSARSLGIQAAAAVSGFYSAIFIRILYDYLLFRLREEIVVGFVNRDGLEREARRPQS